MFTSSLLLNSPSPAVKRSTYVPATANLASVAGALVLSNVTKSGPLRKLHETLSVLPAGHPSSATAPSNCAARGWTRKSMY